MALQGEVHTPVQKILLILRRRYRLVAATWALTMVAVAIYTFTAQKMYRAEVAIEVRPETPLLAATGEDAVLNSSRNMYAIYFKTQQDNLAGRALCEDVLKGLPEGYRSEYESKQDPVRALRGQMDVGAVRSSFILKVGFTDPDPLKAQLVVNQIAKTYVDRESGNMEKLRSEMADSIQSRSIPKVAESLEAKRAEIAALLKDQSFVDLEKRYEFELGAWKQVKDRLMEVELRRAQIDAELAALQGYGSDGMTGLYNPAFHKTKALEALAIDRARVSSDLAREAKKFKEQHPRIQELKAQLASVEERIQEAIGGTLRALRSDTEASDREKASLEKELGRIEGELRTTGHSLTDYRRIEAELRQFEEINTVFVRRHGEANAVSGTGMASVMVRDWAERPDSPDKPRPMQNLMLGAVVGLVLAAAVTLVAEQVDNRILSPAEIETFVGLDVLTVIPQLSEGKAADKHPVVMGTESSLVEFEAFRNLRAEIVTRLERIPNGKVVAILSALQSEGKSTVVLNLSKALAMEGRRVLIFDADMRKPQMMRIFGTKDGKALEELLSGQATLSEIVYPTPVPNLFILGRRAGTSTAAELATSPRYAQALEEARQQFDIVIIDTPPVIQVSETTLIARKADAAVLVVREGSTGRGAVMGAARRLASMNVRLLGAALNCANPGRAGYGYGYGYGYYSYYSSYGYGYGQGYGPETPDPTPAKS